MVSLHCFLQCIDSHDISELFKNTFLVKEWGIAGD